MFIQSKTGMPPTNFDFPWREDRGNFSRKSSSPAQDLARKFQKKIRIWRSLFLAQSSAAAIQLNPLPQSPQSSSTPSNHAAESLFLKLVSLLPVKTEKSSITHFSDSNDKLSLVLFLIVLASICVCMSDQLVVVHGFSRCFFDFFFSFVVLDLDQVLQLKCWFLEFVLVLWVFFFLYI